MTEQDAQRLVRKIVGGGTVRFSGHALQRMCENELSETDIRNIIKGGRPEPGKYCGFEKGSWRYRFETPRMVAVLAFVDEQTAVVVTAWRKEP